MRKFLAMLVVLAAAVAAYTAYYFYVDYPEESLAIGPGSDYHLHVSSGQSLNGVLHQLAVDGVLRQPKILSVYARWRHKAAIKRGEYTLTAEHTLLDLLNMLSRGEVTYRSLTLIEGWSLRQVQQHLAEVWDVPELSFQAADFGIDHDSLEGWIFPDTYFYSVEQSPQRLLAQAVQKMQQVLSQQWQLRDANLPYSSPYELLIMASLIEKETGADHERELIASVFINRLRKNMKLQTDPTVIYALSERYDGNIRKKDLSIDSPFNTYKYKGLPPTPIAMPSLRSIQAAAKPASSSFLFFVAKGNGEHQFSTTLAEHNAAVDRYQRFQRSKNYRSSPNQSAP